MDDNATYDGFVLGAVVDDGATDDNSGTLDDGSTLGFILGVELDDGLTLDFILDVELDDGVTDNDFEVDDGLVLDVVVDDDSGALDDSLVLGFADDDSAVDDGLVLGLKVDDGLLLDFMLGVEVDNGATDDNSETLDDDLILGSMLVLEGDDE